MSINERAWVVEYLNLEPAEVKRQDTLHEKGLQEIAPVILPEGLQADKGRHFGWPVAAMVEDTIVVAFSTLSDMSSGDSGDHFAKAVPGVLRSVDGGATWSPPDDSDSNPCSTIGPASGKGPRMRAIGTTSDGKIILSCSGGIFVSGDKGRHWNSLNPRGLEESGSSGPRIIEDSRHGLILPVARRSNFRGEGETALFLYVSKDGGATWKGTEIESSGLFRVAEPTIFQHDNKFAIVSRNHSGPSTGATSYWRKWCYFAHFVPMNFDGAKDLEDLKFKNVMADIFDRRMDTPDIIYNPVSGRIEMVTTKRNEGVPYAENSYMTLNLWSIDPDKFRQGHPNWRYEGVLLRSKGTMSGGGHPDFPAREGMHPAGSVIDQKRGLQHIFIFAGDYSHIGSNMGKTGVFRVSRSLDTERVRESIRELDKFDEVFKVDERFADLDDWTPSGCSMGLAVSSEDRSVVCRNLAPLPGDNIKVGGGGLHIRTDTPGYYGLHNERAVVLHNYKVEFKARIERYTGAGDTLGVNINYGAQRQRFIIGKNGLYHQKDPDILISYNPMVNIHINNDWHVWTLEMTNGMASVYMDGDHMGNYPAIIDDRLGVDDVPISIYSRTTCASDPAEIKLEYFKLTNIEEE